jgi:secreted PhoX family phosphatase
VRLATGRLQVLIFGLAIALMVVGATVVAASQIAAPHPSGAAGLQMQLSSINIEDNYLTDDPSYVKTTANGWSVLPILTVGEDVPRLGGAAGTRYRMVGIPDGMGAHLLGGTVVLYVNHELGKTVTSRPNIKADGTNDGEFLGSFVSMYLLDKNTGKVKAGRVAYGPVISATNTVLGQAGASAVAFGRFCSGYLAGPHDGLDRYVFLTGEETTDVASMDGRGGQSVAIIDGSAYLLPGWGRFAKENQVVLPGTGENTVVFVMEAGPGTLDNQLYMYVGKKDLTSTHPLNRNGLNTGDLYVFRSKNLAKNSEATFHKGDAAIEGEWVKLANAGTMSDTELEAASDSVNAFTFIRPEDGAYDRNNPGVYYFVTTGAPFQQDGSRVNVLGRLYKLTIDPANPTAGGKLELRLETDKEPDSRKVINPDNIDANAQGLILIQEDATAEGGPEMTRMGRDGSIWAYNILTDGLERIVEIDQLQANKVNPMGHMETSGIIDTANLFGQWTWLFNVQGHGISSAEASTMQGHGADVKLVEGGQILLLSRGKILPLGYSRTY